MKINCEYCDRDGILRVEKNINVNRDVYVCDYCWELLRNPKTALPLIRGHLTLSLRRTIPKERLDRMLNQYMEMLSHWKPLD